MNNTRRPRFTDLYFGLADGKNEADEYPEQFVKSFVNHESVVEKISGSRKFLLLEPKGSGKSAVAWYLELTALERNQLVYTRDISELPLNEIENVETGEAAGPGRAVTAWRLLLLCGLLDVIQKDQSSSLNRNPDFLRVVDALRKEGFLDPTPKRAVLTAAKTTIKIPIPGWGEPYARESISSVKLYHLVPHLEKWVMENVSENSHVLLLDGLDSIFLGSSLF